MKHNQLSPEFIAQTVYITRQVLTPNEVHNAVVIRVNRISPGSVTIMNVDEWKQAVLLYIQEAVEQGLLFHASKNRMNPMYIHTRFAVND